MWGRRKLSLVDVLAAAIQRADEDPARCGPRINYMDLLWRFSDVQKRPERKPVRPMVVPVILGTSSADREA